MTRQQAAEHAFDTPGPVPIHVENGRGSVTVTATDTATTKIHIAGARADEVVVDQDDHGISVIAPKVRGLAPQAGLDIEVSLPVGSDLTAKLGGASLESSGRLGQVMVRSGSGRVTLDRVAGPCVVTTGSGAVTVVEAAADLRARSGSGRIEVDHAGATAAVSTGSGRIRLGRCDGDVAAKSGSGSVEVGEAERDLSLKTASGSITVGSVRRGRTTAKAASGNVRVGIPAGVPVWTDLRTGSGRVRSELPSLGQPEPGADYVELRATTASGSVHLVPA